MIKKQKFRWEIRQREVEANRNKIRIQLFSQNKQIEQPKHSKGEQDILLSSFVNNNNGIDIRERAKEIGHPLLEQYSLMNNESLWGDDSIVDSIFRILYEAIHNQICSSEERIRIVMKISAILKKMLRNDIEWIPTKIEYMITSSSISLPVYLTVLECFANTQLPIYKKSVETAMLKLVKLSELANPISTQQKQSSYLRYLDILTRLYVASPRIKMITNCQILRPLLVLMKEQNPFILMDTKLLKFLIASLGPMIQNKDYPKDILIQILLRVIKTWNRSLDRLQTHNRILFYTILEQITQQLSNPQVLSLLQCNLNTILEIFRKELCRCVMCPNPISSRQRSIFINQVRVILSALNSLFLADEEFNFIQFSYSNEQLQNSFSNIIKNVNELFLTDRSKLYEQLAYFYYYLIGKLEPQHLGNAIGYSRLNTTIYERLEMSTSVSQIILWLKVFEALVSMIITQKLEWESCIQERVLQKIKYLFNSHEHNQVIKIIENILEIVACIDQIAQN